MRRIISFDLDMTLLDHQTYTIPDSAMEALSELRKQGHIIVLATGRDMDNHYSRVFRDLVGADAIIHMNGTKITVGDCLIWDHRMDLGLLKRLLEFAEDRGYSVGATIGDEDYYTHAEQVTALDLARFGECGRQYYDPWKLLDMGVRTLVYVGAPEGAKAIEEAFSQIRLPLFAGLQGADVIERNTSKALGLERLCEYFGCRLEDTVAFGDSMNDYEILHAAGIGIAMGNAIEKLKEAADYVTGDIGDDGVLNACRHFGLIKTNDNEEETDGNQV